MTMGCQQCLPLSVVQLKGEHCPKPHCHNRVVGTFRLSLKSWHFEASADIMTKFKLKALHIIRIEYYNAGGIGNPPSFLWNIGSLLRKMKLSILFCTKLYLIMILVSRFLVLKLVGNLSRAHVVAFLA